MERSDRLELTAALSEAMAPTRERRSAHDPGVVVRDLAVSIADGGDCLSDLGVLRGQETPVWAGGLREHRPPGPQVDRRRSGGSDPRRSREGTEARLGRGSSPRDDHFEVLQLALEQLPEADLDREFLARADIGGRANAFASDCRDAGIRFSVGYGVDERVWEAILALPDAAWERAIDAEGKERDGAQVAELSDRIDLSSWPEGTSISM